MSEFVEICFELGAVPVSLAEQACHEHGATAVTLCDARDEPVLEPGPGEVRLWPATRLQALFAPGTAAAATTEALGRALGIATERFEVRMIADRAWEREWLRDFHAMRFGRRLWICPHHERVEDPTAAVVHMDPGLAFGTGTHPTTALCLEWLDAHPPVDREVIDYGCGSGVLALAAVRLGARLVHCLDIDEQALSATRQNADANGIGPQIRVHAPYEALVSQADVLLANILSDPLIALAGRFAALVRPRGWIVLSGLMMHQESEVAGAYEACFDMHTFGTRDGWIGLCGRRNDRASE